MEGDSFREATAIVMDLGCGGTSLRHSKKDKCDGRVYLTLMRLSFIFSGTVSDIFFFGVLFC